MTRDQGAASGYSSGAERRAKEHLASHVTPMTDPPCDAHALATDVLVLLRENQGLLASCESLTTAAAYWEGAALAGLGDEGRAQMFEGLSRVLGVEVRDV